MSFNPAGLTDDPIQRVRLLVGDISEFPILDDNIYDYQILNTTTELDAALEILDNIINYLTLNPISATIGDTSYVSYNLVDFEERRHELLEKKAKGTDKYVKAPVVIRSDRKDWSDFDFLKYKR